MPAELLSFEERLLVFDLLVSQITDDPHGILLNALPARLRPCLAAGGDTNSLLNQALNLCASDGYAEIPSAAYQFLMVLAPRAINHEAELQRLAARTAHAAAPSANPFLDQVIRDDMIFLDRLALRTAVRRLLAPQTPRPILVVSGPRYCGKSWTSFFIEHLCLLLPNLQFCRISVHPEDDPPSVRDISRDLMVRLGGDADLLPDKLTNEFRWPRELANGVWLQLLNSSRGAATGRVIILDGFNQGKADKNIQDFVLQLAENLTSAGIHPHRLLLIDYDSTALGRLAGQFNPVSLGCLSAAEARDELRRLFAAMGRPDADALSSAVLQDLQDPICDLRELGARAQEMTLSFRP